MSESLPDIGPEESRIPKETATVPFEHDDGTVTQETLTGGQVDAAAEEVNEGMSG